MIHLLLALVLLATVPGSASAQTAIQPPFATDYSFVDLGSVTGVPTNYGGLTFALGDPDTLLLGGAANGINAKIYAVAVTRDAGNHVTGFSGTPTLVSTAPGIGSGGIDGGLTFGPGGILFYASYNDNSLGQIKPGGAAPALQTALGPLGVASSVGALAFVPAGFPGAGRFKAAQYNAPGNWYDVVLGAPDANGTYPISSVTLKATIGGGPEGIIYVSDSNPQFANASVLVCEYSLGKVSAYEVDSNGDPVVATRREFMTGLTGAEGAVVDPLTGDFLFSTYGGGNHVVVVRGFVPPPTTTSTTTVTATSTTTATVPTTTSSSTSTTSSTTTAPAPTSSTSTTTSTSTSTAPRPTTTTLVDDCDGVPPGPTYASLVCRLEKLRQANEAHDVTVALGNLKPKLLVPLGKAIDRMDESRGLCAGDDLKKARQRLKQVGRALSQYSHKLRSNSARKHVPADVRDPLASEADAIGTDTKTLRGKVDCPAAANLVS